MSTFKFNNISDYTSAKGSGGSIYNYLVNNSSVSRSAISYVIETGQTFIDSINVIVPELDGQIGDCLLYNSKDYKFYWLKSNKSWTASDLGGSYVDATDLAESGYTRIGFLIRREGDECLIMSLSNASSGSKWDGEYNSDDSSTHVSVPNVYTNSGIQARGTTSWIASGSMYMGEKYGEEQSNSYYQYTYPVSRDVWKTVVDAVFSNTSISSTTHPGGSYSVTAGEHIGVGSITYTSWVTETINPADYDYDFDKWYKDKILITIPATAGCMMDTHGGRANTKALLEWAASNGRTVPAASVCNNWSVAVSGFEAGQWWLPSVYELWCALKNYEILAKKGGNPTRTWYWSSTQYSGSYACYVNFSTGRVNPYTKSYSSYVRPVTSFKLKRQ